MVRTAGSSVFIDSSYLLALELAGEQHHVAAREHWRAFRRERPRPRVVTTSYVFDEVVTVLNSRRYHGKAVEVGDRLLYNPAIDLVHVDEDLFFSGWKYLSARKDKRFSLTDCISFVLMQRRGITKALTFDSDFAQAGFTLLPQRRSSSGR